PEIAGAVRDPHPQAAHRHPPAHRQDHRGPQQGLELAPRRRYQDPCALQRQLSALIYRFAPAREPMNQDPAALTFLELTVPGTAARAGPAPGRGPLLFVAKGWLPWLHPKGPPRAR